MNTHSGLPMGGRPGIRTLAGTAEPVMPALDSTLCAVWCTQCGTLFI